MLLFSRIVVRVAHRFGVTAADEIDDAIQEICLKITSQARSGKTPNAEDGILEAYLKATIANAAHDYFRGQRAQRRDVLVTTSINENLSASIQGPGAGDLDRSLLIREIEQMIDGSSRDRNVFLLYYRYGWTAKEISAIPSVGLSPKGVESLVFRIIATVRERVKESPPGEQIDKGFS